MGGEQSVTGQFVFVQYLEGTAFGQVSVYKQLLADHEFIIGWTPPDIFSQDQTRRFLAQLQRLQADPPPATAELLHIRHSDLGICGRERIEVLQAYNNFSMRSYVQLARDSQLPVGESEIWYVVLSLLETYSWLEREQVPFSYGHLDNLFVNTGGRIKLYPYTPLFSGEARDSPGKMHRGLAQIVLSLMFPDGPFGQEFKSSIILLRHFESTLEGGGAQFSSLLVSLCRELVKETQFLKELFVEEVGGRVGRAKRLRFSREEETE